MGADIHMVLEKRILPPDHMPGNEQWVGVNAFPYLTTEVFISAAALKAEHPGILEGSTHWVPTNRNYELFAALANVRGPGPAPRGVPKDVSLLAAHNIARWDADGHSHSWMTMDEALPIFVRTKQFGDPGEAVMKALTSGNIEKTLLEYMRYFWSLDDDETLADFRLVFWFDN